MENKVVDDIVEWIINYIKKSNTNGVVIGMSGGKDSFVCAKLCVNAVGKDNVLGVIMPNGEMKDISDAVDSCEYLGIPYVVVPITDAYNSIIQGIAPALEKCKKQLNSVSTQNTPPRLRMATLYAIAGSLGYLVANTSNLSEKMVGYTTKWGDNVGDFAPLVNFTKTEVCELGIKLGLPHNLVYKTPSDGLSGMSDEQKLGFSYDELDEYIRNGKKGEHFDKIERAHKVCYHKRNPIISYDSHLPNSFEEK